MLGWAGFGLPQLGSGVLVSVEWLSPGWVGTDSAGLISAELDWRGSARLAWVWLGSPELDGVRFGRVGVSWDLFG